VLDSLTKAVILSRPLATPISTPACEYQFGLYAVSKDCSTTYIKCAHGEPHEQDCDAGLAYDERIHGCNWPDQLLEHGNGHENYVKAER